MKTDLFQSCGHCCVFQICWHIECSTFTAPFDSYSPWNSPGQNTGVGSLSLLQGIFPTQVSCTVADSLPAEPQGKPISSIVSRYTLQGSSKEFWFHSPILWGYKVSYKNCKYVNSLYVVPLEKALVQFSHSVMSNSLQPQGLQHARLPCPSPTPKADSNSCP